MYLLVISAAMLLMLPGSLSSTTVNTEIDSHDFELMPAGEDLQALGVDYCEIDLHSDVLQTEDFKAVSTAIGRMTAESEIITVQSVQMKGGRAPPLAIKLKARRTKTHYNYSTAKMELDNSPADYLPDIS